MRFVCALFTVVASVLLCGLPTPLAAQETAEGPRIKFFDDLLHPFESSGRNPYEERIETDRHDFTQSTRTVGRFVCQVEAGYTYFYKDHAEEIEQSHTTPEMLLRLGLTDDIEFRLRWNYAWRFIEDHGNIDSAEDLRWSFKLAVTDQCCWLPESALQIRSTAPTGGTAWSTERVQFGLDYIYLWEISERWEAYGSTGFGTDGLADFGLVPEHPASDRFMAWSQSAGVGIELAECMTLYAEYFGLFSHNREPDFAVHVFNMGVDFFVTDNFVLDIRAGKGLSDDADDLFAGFGGGYRF
jgi:hypothetical protein